jgi:hypothetical protein
MSQDDAEQRRISSVTALKAVYYVIIGLAITEALARTFIREGKFISLSVFNLTNLPTTFLLLALVPTICRFVHGASMHLDMEQNKRYKLLFDFFGFLVQGALFYLMALSLNDPWAFAWLFILMLAGDVSWIKLLLVVKYTQPNLVMKQWLRSDITLIVLLIVLLILAELLCPNVVNKEVTCICESVILLILAVLATVWDYVHNRDFYFPRAESKYG